MAVGWVLRKVMGKRDEPDGSPAQPDTENNSSADAENRYLCCRKSTWRWIITLVVSLQLLVFVLVSVPLRRHHGQQTPLIQAPIMFMFKLERQAEVIQNYKSELESNLSSHIHAPNMKVSLYSVKQVADTKWAELRFQLLPESSNSTYDVKDLRKSLVKLFLRQRNLPLTPAFGKVFDFQINKMQGGITIVPEKSSLSKRSALFNFTLPNGTISTVSRNFAEFKKQLHAGLCLRPNEVLITRLTNLNGSTVEQSVIVENSVFKSPGHHLPPIRLKELAHRVSKHRRNLGLNHTMFGKVRELQLSPVLQHFLWHKHAPGPAPAHAPGPSPAQQTGYSYHQPSHDWQHSVFLAPAPAPVHSALQAGFASSPEASQVVPDHSAHQQGIASVPAASPSSSASSVESLSAVIFVLVASVVSLYTLA